MTPDLRDHIGDIARRLLGAPNKALSTRSQMRFGNNGSVAVELNGKKAGTWFDHEAGLGGGAWEMLRLKGGLADRDISAWLERELGIRAEPSVNGHDRSSAQRVLKTYNYHDEKGAPLFRVQRWGPCKTFTQEAPNGKGGWKSGKGAMDGVRRVPYRLPELVAAAAAVNGQPWRVYIVEGEKDADRLAQWGLTATTNPGGAGKWLSEFNRYLAGADAVIIPDNDDGGRMHAQAVASSLSPTAAVVRILELQGLPGKGDISNWIEAGGSQSDIEMMVDLTPPFAPAEEQRVNLPEHERLQVYDAGDIDVTQIPPRGWLLGVTFCRKFLSGLISEGGGGKTAIRYVQYLASAIGRNLTGEHVHHRSRVLIVCLEDNLDEVRRRIGAAMLHHGVTSADVKHWLFYSTPKGLKLLKTGPHGARSIGGLNSELRKTIAELNIDIVGLDPFVKSHSVEENDNNAIDQVCIMLADIADEFDCAIDIVSHARKGQPTPGDADRERGASSKKDAGRLMRTVTGMTEAEAKLYDVASANRSVLIRVDDAKVNLTPRSADPVWFKLVSVPLGNTFDPRYPKGDNVQTVEPWNPPDIWKNITVSVANKILDRIDQGPEPGRRYSPAPQAKDRAAWLVVQEFCAALNEVQCKKVIDKWLKTGVLAVEDYDDPKAEHSRKGLFVIKRPGDTWEA